MTDPVTPEEARRLADSHPAPVDMRMALRSLAAQLEEAQERERQLREALEQIEQLDRMGHNSEVAAEMGYIARVTLDSTQTHGGSDD